MRKGLLLMLIFIVAAVNADAANNVIIVEVLYDSMNDAGGEAVVLYNPTQSPINIGGWIIATESSPADATIPQNIVLMPGQYFLISDSGWNSQHSDIPADHEEAITLANSDSGIALISNGTIMDSVGWGNSSNIQLWLYEGQPANIGKEGQSLQRKQNGESFIDTNNNFADFTYNTPVLRNSKFGAGASEIKVYAEVFSIAPIISMINITTDDDGTVPGVQVLPLPGKERNITIQTIIDGNADNATLIFHLQRYPMVKETINSSSSLYKANILIPFYLSPGNNTVEVFASASGFEARSSVSFTLLRLLSMELDTDVLSFSAATGGVDEVKGDLAMDSKNSVTLRNTGNVPVNMELSGTDLSYGSSVIDVGNMQYTFDEDYRSIMSGTLSSRKERKEVGLQPGKLSLQKLSFKLNVPLSSKPGNYTGSIFLSAVS